MDTSHSKALRDQNFEPPATLTAAVSLIQRYALQEEGGVTLHDDYFTLEHRVAFIWVGAKYAFIDTLLWVIIFVAGGIIVQYVQDNYLTAKTTTVFGLFVVYGHPLYWLTKMGSFSGLIMHTWLCWLASRYYRGNVPKRAINSLFLSRSVFLICFALLTFYALGLTYKHILSESILSGIYQAAAVLHKITAEELYAFLQTNIKRFLFESAITVLLSAAAATALPFLGIALYRRRKTKDRILGTRQDS